MRGAFAYLAAVLVIALIFVHLVGRAVDHRVHELDCLAAQAQAIQKEDC